MVASPTTVCLIITQIFDAVVDQFVEKPRTTMLSNLIKLVIHTDIDTFLLKYMAINVQIS